MIYIYIFQNNGINEWSQADLTTELNTLYLNGQRGTCYKDANNETKTCNFTSNGLNHGGSDLIEDAVWNTGTTQNYDLAQSAIARDWYLAERRSNTSNICTSGDRCTDTVRRASTWTGKVGLMYPSDYVYATGGSGTYDRAWCLAGALYNWSSTDASTPYNTNCAKKSWLYNSSVGQWTMSPMLFSGHADYVAIVYSMGYVYGASAFWAARRLSELEGSHQRRGWIHWKSIRI